MPSKEKSGKLIKQNYLKNVWYVQDILWGSLVLILRERALWASGGYVQAWRQLSAGLYILQVQGGAETEPRAGKFAGTGKRGPHCVPILSWVLFRRWGEHALLACGVVEDHVRQRRAILLFPEGLNRKARQSHLGGTK